MINRSTDNLTNQPINRSTDNVTNQPINRSTDNAMSASLTPRQCIVLKYIYFNRPFKVHGEDGLGIILGIGSSNIRNQLKSLVRKGYIYKPYSINNGIYNGTTCRIIERKCFPIFGKTPIKNPSLSKPVNQTSNQPINQSTDNVTNQPINQSTDNVTNQPINRNAISSSSLTKTTTVFTTEIIKELNNNSELHFWVQRGVTSKQLHKWMHLTNCNLSTMVRYLSYCRFDMIDLDLERSKPVQNVLNWFYKILKTTGGYPKPKGYKSHEEKMLEEEREELEKQRRIAKERCKIFEEKQKVEFDAKYWEMMNHPESEEYKACFSRINTIAKKLWNKKGNKSLSFRTEMKKEFEKLLQEDGDK